MTSIPLAELAQHIGAQLEGDGDRTVRGPASLAEAGPDEISFLAQPRYQAQLATTRAAAVVVAEDQAVERTDLAVLRHADPNAAFTAVIRAFSKELEAPRAGVHPSACVEDGAEVEPGATIGPLCHVAAGARVASGAWLVSRVTVGPGARVGADTVLHPGVTLYDRVEVGARCIVHAGTVIGSDGYGFEPTPAGWVKVPQCGTVVVEDDVELGANVTIDRARFGATRLGRGVKVDNLVHIGHNVVVGDNALLVAQVGIAGSTTVGPWAILGGKVGLAGHLTIGAKARVGAASAVFTDVPSGVDFIGNPARERMETLRAQAAGRRIPKVLDELRELKARLAELEAKHGARS